MASKDSEVFDDYKADWWNPKGRLRSLHKITPLRFDYFREVALMLYGSSGDSDCFDGKKIADVGSGGGSRGCFHGKKIADVGCGGGLLSECFAKEGAEVVAIDLAATAIEAAREHAEAEGLTIDYRNISVEEFLKENREAFDVVVCSEVLEHVDDLQGFIEKLSALLKPDGILFFSTINKTLKARFFALFIAEDILGLVEQGTHSYDKFIKPSQLIALLKENSATLEDIKGISFDIFKRVFAISGDVSVNYIGYAIKK